MRRFEIEMVRGRRGDTVEVLGETEAEAKEFLEKKYAGQKLTIVTCEDVTDAEGLNDLTGVLNVPAADGEIEAMAGQGGARAAGTYEET